MIILLIDDEPSIRRSVAGYLEDMDHEVLQAGNGQEGLDILRERQDVDLVMVDLAMPVMDGFTFIAFAVDVHPDLPIIVLSGAGVLEEAVKAVRLGAWDFLSKPITNFGIVDHAIARCTERAQLLKENSEYRKRLEKLVGVRTEQLERAHVKLVMCLGKASEFRDNETGRHVVRVGEICAIIARALKMDRQFCSLIRTAAQMHDVGKIAIPDCVLLKTTALTEDEQQVIKTHCEAGFQILCTGQDSGERLNMAQVPAPFSSQQDVLAMAQSIALCHHERWDGSGYPRGLSGEDIPLEARIVSVVDAFDALCSKRPYKDSLPIEVCIPEILAGSGSQFDPTVVEAFRACLPDILAIREEWKD